jgi:hypothetical protein
MLYVINNTGTSAQCQINGKPMKKAGGTFLFALLVSLLIASYVSAAQDSITRPQKATAQPAKPVVSDDELILDEPAGAIVPEANKPVPAVAANPTPARPEAAAKPVVKVSADTAPKAAMAPVPIADTTAVSNAAVPAPAPPKEAATAKDTGNAVVDEELILDGGAEDLLGREKTAQTKTAAKTDSTGADSAAGAAVIVPDSSMPAVSADSTGKPAAESSATQSITPLPKQVAAQTKIEKVRSINFSANLQEYRSPKLAMLMSLLLPGSGQVYAKSNLLAAGFLALEAAVFGTGYAFIAKGKSKKKEARAYADSHYDTTKYKGYSSDLKQYLSQQFDADKAASIFRDSIFYGDSLEDQPFLDNARQHNDTYYDDIQGLSSIFVRGWKDVEPEFTGQSGFGGIDSDHFTVPSGAPLYLVSHTGDDDLAFGFSKYQATYVDMINTSRSLARTGQKFYMSLLVNHIASAVIAGIVAKKHNDALLGQESVWRRIEVEQNQVNTGSHTVNGYALGITF